VLAAQLVSGTCPSGITGMLQPPASRAYPEEQPDRNMPEDNGNWR
jgi:hypothetical protein